MRWNSWNSDAEVPYQKRCHYLSSHILSVDGLAQSSATPCQDQYGQPLRPGRQRQSEIFLAGSLSENDGATLTTLFMIDVESWDGSDTIPPEKDLLI